MTYSTLCVHYAGVISHIDVVYLGWPIALSIDYTVKRERKGQNAGPGVQATIGCMCTAERMKPN